MSRRTPWAVALILAGLVAVSGPAPAYASVCGGTAPSDFNGDGVADLATVEFSGQGLGGGRLHVVYGTRHGLVADATGTALDDRLIPADAASGNAWGDSLAAGDFDGDGCSDLAVADPEAAASGQADAGRVLIYRGGAALGLHGPPLVVTSAAAGQAPASGDEFGAVLAAADVSGDGRDDLIAGAPVRDLVAGALYVIPGGTLAGGKRFTQGDGTVPGASGTGHQFGLTLATGDVDGDGVPDVAVGAAGVHGGAGGVIVLPGAGGPALLEPGRLWWEGTPGVPGVPHDTDRAGVSVALGDFNGDGYDDLAMGVPAKHHHAGLVDVLYSAGPGGLTATGSQAWTQDSPGVPDHAEPGDDFGAKLVAGDFRGDGRDSLAVGVPHESFGGHHSAGLVQILAGGADGLSTGTAWSEATPGIAGTPQLNDGFGDGLATLRLRSAHRDDLLIDVVGQDLTGVIDAGLLHVVPGSTHGLTAVHAQALSAATPGIKGTPCPACAFGLVSR